MFSVLFSSLSDWITWSILLQPKVGSHLKSTFLLDDTSLALAGSCKNSWKSMQQSDWKITWSCLEHIEELWGLLAVACGRLTGLGSW